MWLPAAVLGAAAATAVAAAVAATTAAATTAAATVPIAAAEPAAVDDVNGVAGASEAAAQPKPPSQLTQPPVQPPLQITATV